VDEDYPAGPGIIEPLPEQSNWRGLELSTLKNDVYVWRYAVIAVRARNEWMNDHTGCTSFLPSFDISISQVSVVTCMRCGDRFVAHLWLVCKWKNLLSQSLSSVDMHMRNWSHITAHLVLFVGAMSSKSLTLCDFKLDRDEIWRYCSSTKYASVSGQTSIWCHTFKMAAMKCCYLVNAHSCPAPMRQRPPVFDLPYLLTHNVVCEVSRMTWGHWVSLETQLCLLQWRLYMFTEISFSTHVARQLPVRVWEWTMVTLSDDWAVRVVTLPVTWTLHLHCYLVFAHLHCCIFSRS